MVPQKNATLLIVGPLPPPPTGSHVTFQNLCDEVQRRFGTDRVDIIDTSQKIMKKNVTRIASLGNLKQAWRIARQFWRKSSRSKHVLIFGSNGFMLSMAPILVMLAKLRKIPVFLRPFGGSLDRYAAGLNPLLRRILLWTLRHADGLSVETELLQRGLSSVIGKKIQAAPNYRYIPSTTRPARLPHDSSQPLRLIYLGIVGQEKGVFVLLEAMRRLAEESSRVRCDIYGPVSPASAERFHDEVARTENATYGGTLEPDEAIRALSEHDALVLPTYYQGEGHPGVVIEAMIAGIPVISTHHRSIPELIEDGVNGLLMAPRDVHALTAAIHRLDQDRELTAELSQGSWQSRRRFDTRQVVPAILKQMGVDVDDSEEPLPDPAAEEEISSVPSGDVFMGLKT